MMLLVQDVAKRFGKTEAVRGVSFAVEAGESFGLLGPNGAGKSTIISMICGLLAPNTGSIVVDGYDVSTSPDTAKQVMGAVPQDIALYPTLSARENLYFWGAMYGLSGSTLKARVDEALELVSLTERQKDRIDTYSGGMKRRINIAASLLHRPRLLIMDEPTVGIDPQSRSNILQTVQRLNQEMGMTVVYTSHYMEEVEFLCQRLAIIDHGKLIAQGPLDQVRRMAGSATTIRLKVQEPDEMLAQTVAGVPGVRQCIREHEMLTALLDDGAAALPSLLAVLGDAGKRVLGVEVQEPNLEAVFLHLTGRALRD